jgi:Major Facilitator Superfamily
MAWARCIIWRSSQTDSAASQRKGGTYTFALLFSLESMVRALNAAVLSTQAYDLLGSSQQVSVLATCVSMSVLGTTLLMPLLLGNLRRRWAYTFGLVLLMAGSLGLASFTVAGQVLGTYLRNTGTSLVNVTLQLYILDHIRKADLVRSEPMRLAISTLAWTAGPWIGISLYDAYGSFAPQALALAFGLVLLGAFWFLRLSENSVLKPGNLKGFTPWKNVHRFIKQPRLRLAWAIAFWRSCFWGGLFTYGPLLLIEGGLSKKAGGIMISASQILLLATVLFGKVARHTGVRPVITASFIGMAVFITAAGVSGTSHPYLTIGLLLISAFFATGLDGVGAIPFLRAVRNHERPGMTPVYRSFIELSELIPGFFFAILLLFFPTAAVFVLLGLSMLVAAWLSWTYLPKSM